ncbi:ANTAR domain-containing protein [Kribbella capetownensis]|uniref:ANTAR domain-containing protein n=1 Tax=Kribbella capetownensis TaxID=1572659 RepID=A0A4R0IVT2_9ACTN|nr:ANTAR domain-containing protein [Kribbella capetownensis]
MGWLRKERFVATLDKTGLLARLARAIAEPSGEPLEVRLCHAYLRILGGNGAALTLSNTRAERVTLCSTDDAAARLEDLQEVLGEGPGNQAYRSGTIVTLDLNAQGSAWSNFTAAAQAAVGELTLHAVPIRPAGQVLGVLTTHHSAPPVPDAATAQFLADAIGTALLQNPEGYLHDLDSRTWADRAAIHQATGMVLTQLGITVTDAVALLRAHAFAHNASMTEVARLVVDRRLRFADPDTSLRPDQLPGSSRESDRDTDTDGGTQTS